MRDFIIMMKTSYIFSHIFTLNKSLKET